MTRRGWADQSVSRHDGEALQVVLDDIAGEHRLWLPDIADGQGLAVLIPLDPTFGVRLESAARFHRRLSGVPSGPLPRRWRLTARQHRRYALMLRAFDLREAGATYRDIAVALIDVGAAKLPAREWKTASARAAAIRLVADARLLTQGRYRKLLRGA